MDPVFGTSFVISAYAWTTIFVHAKVVLRKHFNDKQILNLISVVHNLGCLLQCALYVGTESPVLIASLVSWSISYFLVDAFNYSTSSVMWYHHIGSVIVELFMLRLITNPQDQDGFAVFWGFFLAEISNHPMYLVYHLIKGSMYVPPWLGWLEFVSFFSIRFIGGIYFLVFYQIRDRILWYLMSIFWLVSMKWSHGIYRAARNEPVDQFRFSV